MVLVVLRLNVKRLVLLLTHSPSVLSARVQCRNAACKLIVLICRSLFHQRVQRKRCHAGLEFTSVRAGYMVMSLLRTSVVFSMVLLAPTLQAQSSEQSDEQILQPLLQENVQSADAADIEALERRPLNLLRCRLNQLSSLPEITPQLARKILSEVQARHYASLELFLDEQEQSLNLNTLQRKVLMRYCLIAWPKTRDAQRSDEGSGNQAHQRRSGTAHKRTALESDSLHQWSVEFRSRQQLPLQKNRAQLEGLFAGSSLSSYERCVLRSPLFEAGCVLEKDAGEASFADFLSAYCQIPITSTTQCILGDFRIVSGLGSVLAPGMMRSKSSNVVAPLLQLGSGLKVSRSTQNSSFFRGIAVEHFLGTDSSQWRLCVAISQRQRDASIDSLYSEVRSLDLSDLHRTSSELQKRSVLKEQAFMSTLDFLQGSVHLSATALALRYSHVFSPSSSAPILGQQALLLSATAAYQLNGTAFNAELGRDQQGNLCFLSSLAHEAARWSAVINFRSIAANYRSPYASTFSNYGSNSNELGLYLGVFVRLPAHAELRCFADVFRSFIPRYGFAMPSAGLDLSAEYRVQLQRQTDCVLRYRESSNSDAARAANNELQIFERRSHQFSAQLQQSFDSGLRLSLLLMHSHKHTERYLSTEHSEFPDSQLPSSGTMLRAGLRWTLVEGLIASCHYALASTDSFASALYAAEQMAPGYWSSVPLYDQSARVLLSVLYTPNETLSLWLRYDLSAKNDSTTYSSGLTEIQGNMQSRLVFQCDVAW